MRAAAPVHGFEFFNYRRVRRKSKGVTTVRTHLFMPHVTFRDKITAHNR
jgi:hypothetical protein